MTLTFVGAERQQGIRARIQQQVRNTPAEDKVFFLEAIDFARLHTFMRDYHVFIHPSCYTDQKDCEGGAPIVLLDAQATGMPIISTTHCDIPEEVIHDKTGLLSPEKDSISLSESIKKVYWMGQEEYDRIAHNAREHVRQNYNIRLNSKKLRKIYADFLDQRSR